MKLLNGLNADVKRRDGIIYGKLMDYRCGGIYRFYGMDIAILLKLINENFISLDDRQNCAPTVESFRNFMIKYPHYYAHGYTVSPKRSDYRVTIEGLRRDPAPVWTIQEKDGFTELFSRADEFDPENGYCWYD